MARPHCLRRGGQELLHLAWACTLLAAPAVAGAADGVTWCEVERGDGIVIEMGEAGGERMALRLSLDVDVSPAAVRAVLLDLERFPEWAGGLAQWRVLSRSDSEADVYARHATPWPLSDRDYVAHYTWQAEGTSFRLEARATQSARVAEVSGVHRLRQLHTLWQVSAAPSGAAVVYSAASALPLGMPRALVEWVWRQEVRRTVASLRAAVRARRPAPASVSAR